MRLIGDNGAKLELIRDTQSSDLLRFNFSCEWCSGGFSLFSDDKNFTALISECQKIANGKKKAAWISEEGDLELKFSVSSFALVSVASVCKPSVRLETPGSLEFEVEISLASFDAVVDLSKAPFTEIPYLGVENE